MFNILSFLFPVKVTNKVYNKFVDTENVSDTILRVLAFKVKKQESLSSIEYAIFCGKTSEINEIIVEISLDK